MINPRMFDDMSWRMAEVYGACVDRLLINIAHYFPYIQAGQEPRGTFDYMVRMLANMGQVNRESLRIIENALGGADAQLRYDLATAVWEVIKDIDPPLRKAAEQGLFGFRTPQPILDPSTTQAFQMYYKQSADKLNLVNTVMLESTQHAYQNTVTDVVNRINKAQGAINVAAGEVVVGAETWNRAMNQAVAAMAQQGLTGFIDHAGRHWTPEAYVAMDIRTTVSNTARATVWEQNEEYGNDMYSVSSHNGARPLCYPWQGKVISRSDTVRDVEDLQGNVIHVYAQSETSYGEPAGLFGINCGHYPYPFIPGMSMVRGEPQDPEENEKTYQESQEQRRLERELRTAKRDLAVEKARGAPKEVLREKKDKVDQARGKLDDFCEKTGRHRRSAREGTPINARFPDKGSYTVGDMPQTVRNQMREFYQQQAQPIPPTAPVAQATPANVAQQATQSPPETGTIRSATNFAELVEATRNKYGIPITDDVLSLRFDMVHEALIGVDDMFTEYPGLAKSVRTITTSSTGIMSCNGEAINFNPAWFHAPERLNRTIAECVASHWWPENTTIRSIAAHECGHAVEWFLIDGQPVPYYEKVMMWNKRTHATELVREAVSAVKKTDFGKGKKTPDLINSVSTYAARNRSETIAESFADVYANGENANPLATEIVRICRERYNRLVGGATQ